ncbi:MAG TPA: HIT domain-containing protein [candidate division Zixibacteria bacterium]|nr:HIT domain-containing protein [candidate division Zixibacteria bacterium]
MDRIWAPWRIEYIEQPKLYDECFICKILKEKKDDKNLILYRGKNAIVLLNKYPYIAGHLMVAPNQHLSNLEELPIVTNREIWELTTKTVILLKKAVNPEGFNIGMNLGAVSGAGLKTHVHIHIVPRWTGDTNFMPIISGTRAISEGLERTYEKFMNFIDIYEE